MLPALISYYPNDQLLIIEKNKQLHKLLSVALLAVLAFLVSFGVAIWNTPYNTFGLVFFRFFHGISMIIAGYTFSLSLRVVILGDQYIFDSLTSKIYRNKHELGLFSDLGTVEVKKLNRKGPVYRFSLVFKSGNRQKIELLRSYANAQSLAHQLQSFTGFDDTGNPRS